MFIRQLLRTIVILLPLFCFTWVIGLFAVAPGQAGQVFAILFIVANSLQVYMYIISFTPCSCHFSAFYFISLHDNYVSYAVSIFVHQRVSLYLCFMS